MAQCLIFYLLLRDVRVWDHSQCGLCTSEHIGSLRGESLEEYSMYLNKVSVPLKDVLGRMERRGRPIPFVTPGPRPRDPDFGRIKMEESR